MLWKRKDVTQCARSSVTEFRHIRVMMPSEKAASLYISLSITVFTICGVVLKYINDMMRCKVISLLFFRIIYGILFNKVETICYTLFNV